MSEIKKKPNIYIDTDSIVYAEEDITISILVDTLKKITQLKNIDDITLSKVLFAISKLILDIRNRN